MEEPIHRVSSGIRGNGSNGSRGVESRSGPCAEDAAGAESRFRRPPRSASGFGKSIQKKREHANSRFPRTRSSPSITGPSKGHTDRGEAWIGTPAGFETFVVRKAHAMNPGSKMFVLRSGSQASSGGRPVARRRVREAGCPSAGMGDWSAAACFAQAQALLRGESTEWPPVGRERRSCLGRC